MQIETKEKLRKDVLRLGLGTALFIFLCMGGLYVYDLLRDNPNPTHDLSLYISLAIAFTLMIWGLIFVLYLYQFRVYKKRLKSYQKANFKQLYDLGFELKEDIVNHDFLFFFKGSYKGFIFELVKLGVHKETYFENFFRIILYYTDADLPKLTEDEANQELVNSLYAFSDFITSDERCVFFNIKGAKPNFKQCLDRIVSFCEQLDIKPMSEKEYKKLMAKQSK